MTSQPNDLSFHAWNLILSASKAAEQTPRSVGRKQRHHAFAALPMECSKKVPVVLSKDEAVRLARLRALPEHVKMALITRYLQDLALEEEAMKKQITDTAQTLDEMEKLQAYLASTQGAVQPTLSLGSTSSMAMLQPPNPFLQPISINNVPSNQMTWRTSMDSPHSCVTATNVVSPLSVSDAGSGSVTLGSPMASASAMFDDQESLMALQLGQLDLGVGFGSSPTSHPPRQ